MNLVVAAHSVDPERSRSMQAQLGEAGLDVTVLADTGSGSWLGVSRPDANVVGIGSAGDVHVGAIGTGLGAHGRAEGAAIELAQLTCAASGVLPPVAADRAAISFDRRTGAVTASVGAGWHRLFVGELPGGGAVVCSNLAVTRRLLGADSGPDRSYEDFLLGFGFLPDDRTVHRGVRALGAGTYRWGIDQAPPAEPVGGESPDPTQPVAVPSFEAAADELHDRFMASVEELAGDDHEVAVMLGGFDSALVAAALARLGRKVTTYTFGFGDARYEQRNVSLVTREVGSTERWVHFTPEVTMDGLRAFGSVFAQPGPQPHYQLHTLHASRRIRADGFDAVFTGDGCDAIFLGYPMVNTRARLLSRLARSPRPLTKTALRVAGTRAADRHLGHVARMGRSTLGNLLLSMPERGHLPTRYLDDVALGRLRTGGRPPQAEQVDAIRHRLAAEVAGLDPVRLAFHGNSMTGQSRVKVDGAVGATGLREYSPFLDPALRSFVEGLPVEYLRPAGSSAGSAGKAVLIEMIRRHRLLPDTIVDMPKQSPVDAPIDQWYTGPLRTELLDLLGHLPFAWDRTYVEELLRPKFAERIYRDRVALGHHTFQAVGLLAAYASFRCA